MFAIDEYLDEVPNIIKSFDISKITINKFYILVYEKINLKSNDIVEYVDLSLHDNNVNKCYNQIRNKSDIWIIWKPTYYLAKCLQSVIEKIAQNKYQIYFVFGIKLFLDTLHVKKDNEYSCKSGGCFIVSNKVTLNENELYFNVNKSDHQIFYDLYENDNYYFFDISLTKRKIMLLHDFESNYMIESKKNKINTSFVEWYSSCHNDIESGMNYVEKKYKFDGIKTKQLHNYVLPKIVSDINKINYHNFDATYGIIINSSEELICLETTIKSIGSKKLFIILNGNFGDFNISTSNLSLIKNNTKLTYGECVNQLNLNINTDLIIIVKSGVIFNANKLTIELHNQSKSSIFVYNEEFVSFKTEICELLNESKNFNELVSKLKHISRPIYLETSNRNKLLRIEIVKYDLNSYFDKIYSRKKIEIFDKHEIKYEISNLEKEILVGSGNSVLICDIDESKYFVKNNFVDIFESRIKDKYKIIILGHGLTGYNNCENTDTFYLNPPLTSHINFNKINIIKNLCPKVSVIMTVYNKEKYLDFAIKSILRQTYKNVELVIVEDCSTDNSKEIVKKYLNIPNVKIVLNDKNMGCYSSRNIGIEYATGEIIGFQDADDYSLKTRIEKQIELMIYNNLLMVGCNMMRSHIPNINYENDNLILSEVNSSIKHFECDCCCEMFGYPTLLIKKELFDKYGKYIERPKGMDMEFPERVLFYEINKKFGENESSWNYLDKQSNCIYSKLNELMVISPEMNELNISNSLQTDTYLKNKLWRSKYV